MLAHGQKFVLTARFTQDCLENVFSCVRYRNPAPTPVEFHQALRLISVGQFLTTVKSGSYQEDDNSFLVDFLETIEPVKMTTVRVEDLLEDRAPSEFTETEKNILFHLAGYIAHKVCKNGKTCNECKTAMIDNDCASLAEEDSTLLALKEYKPGALFRPSHEVLNLVHQVEHLFRRKTPCMELQNAVGVLEREAQAFTSRLPSCHGVHDKIIKRCIRLRLRIESKKIRDERKSKKSDGHHGSKSQTKKANRNSTRIAPVISKQSEAQRIPKTLQLAMETFGITVAHPKRATPVSLALSSATYMFPSSCTYSNSMSQPQNNCSRPASSTVPHATSIPNTLQDAMEAVGIPVVYPNTATPVNLSSAPCMSPSSFTHSNSISPPHHSSEQQSSAQRQEFTSQTLSAKRQGEQ